MKHSQKTIQWLEEVLNDRFGHYFKLNYFTDDKIKLSLFGFKNGVYFDTLEPFFHESNSNFSSMSWSITKEGFFPPIQNDLPAPSSNALKCPLIEFKEKNAYIHYDILGLTYWMLSRLEEVGCKNLDAHQRFPATSSHAYIHGYLDRPIVDEWLNILGQVLSRVWPQLKLKQQQFSINVSHDVDVPSLSAFKSWSLIFRMMGAFLLKQKNYKGFIQTPYIKIVTRNKLCSIDPNNTFDWLMDVSERHGLESAFYFICGGKHAQYDSDYEINHPVIRSLMRRIHERGHEIGLHPSYSAFQSPKLIKEEAQCLKNQCAEDGLFQEKWGGRMHYLRWEQPTTLRAWELAGMDYDSTLGYADSPGFRCGTCHEYPAFDPVAQQMLNLRIRPLIVMEATVIDEMYLGLGVSDAAIEKILILKERCKQVGGKFTLLWHNSYFQSADYKSMYEKCIESC